MKNTLLIVSAGFLMLASCSTGKQQNNLSGKKPDSTATAISAPVPLTARIVMPAIIKSADSLQFRFTIYNSSSKSQKFCKWHTPFEPPMSKYLDIRTDQGGEVSYRGIMAKRIMPPPAGSYIEIKPGDSLSTLVNVSKQYPLERVGKYTLRYNAQDISGVVATDSVSFIYEK
jgi:hypothetical protein